MQRKLHLPDMCLTGTVCRAKVTPRLSEPAAAAWQRPLNCWRHGPPCCSAAAMQGALPLHLTWWAGGHVWHSLSAKLHGWCCWTQPMLCADTLEDYEIRQDTMLLEGQHRCR